MYVDDFTAKLAKIGLVILNNGAAEGVVNAELETLGKITEDQRDELQTIIDDLNTDGVNSVTFEPFEVPANGSMFADWVEDFQSGNYKIDDADIAAVVDRAMSYGRAEALSEIDRTPVVVAVTPVSADGPVLDALVWANTFGSGRMNINPQIMAPWFALAIEAGRQANRVRGLNGDDDEAALDVAEVNAVELVVSGGDGKTWLNVDGRCRARFGKTSIVVVEYGGSRNVLRKPADPDAPVEAQNAAG